MSSFVHVAPELLCMAAYKMVLLKFRADLTNNEPKPVVQMSFAGVNNLESLLGSSRIKMHGVKKCFRGGATGSIWAPGLTMSH